MYTFSIMVIAVAICSTSLRAMNVEVNDEFKLIETSHGVIRGKLEITLFKQRRYFSFRGIPYARPPVGPLRFKVLCV